MISFIGFWTLLTWHSFTLARKTRDGPCIIHTSLLVQIPMAFEQLQKQDKSQNHESPHKITTFCFLCDLKRHTITLALPPTQPLNKRRHPSPHPKAPPQRSNARSKPRPKMVSGRCYQGWCHPIRNLGIFDENVAWFVWSFFQLFARFTKQLKILKSRWGHWSWDTYIRIKYPLSPT